MHPLSPTQTESLDCATCGACCRSGQNGCILVTADDIAAWKAQALHHLADALQPGHFGEMAFATRPSGACVHLGTPEGPNRCAIYPERATVCRDFQAGTRQCYEFRRRYGVGRQDP